MSKHKHRKFKPLNTLEKQMSQFLDTFRSLLAKVAQGNPSDPQTKADVQALKDHMTTVDATDADQTTAINELVTKLGSISSTGGTATLSPANGSVNGGETITITGSGFTGANSVSFGNVSGTGLSVQSDTTLTVISPAQPAGTVAVTILTPSATIAAGSYTLA